jgi:serine/threonine protein kinase
LTAEGVILGTLQYMSPEQLEGKPADRRTDIFAFGAVVHEMITGTKAWHATSQAGLVSAILADEPQPIDDLVPDVAPLLAQAIARCLSKDPDERWQTASDLLFQLRSIASTSPRVDDRQSRPRGRTIERAGWTPAGRDGFGFAHSIPSASSPCRGQTRRTRRSGRQTANGLGSSPITP